MLAQMVWWVKVAGADRWDVVTPGPWTWDSALWGFACFPDVLSPVNLAERSTEQVLTLKECKKTFKNDRLKSS